MPNIYINARKPGNLNNVTITSSPPPGVLPAVCLIYINTSIYLCIKKLQRVLSTRQPSSVKGKTDEKEEEKVLSRIFCLMKLAMTVFDCICCLCHKVKVFTNLIYYYKLYFVSEIHQIKIIFLNP